MTKKDRDAEISRIERLCRFHHLDPACYVHMTERHFVARILSPLMIRHSDGPPSIWRSHPPCERKPKECVRHTRRFIGTAGAAGHEADAEHYWVRYGCEMAAEGRDRLPSERLHEQR